MKTLLIGIALLSFFLGNAQLIDWNKVNSNTLENFISLHNIQQESYSASSTVVQFGNNNNAELSTNSKTNIIIQQFGDQNSIYFNNIQSDKDNKTAITTQGSNNIIDITGSNSVSDGLNMNVKANNKTIFIRNY